MTSTDLTSLFRNWHDLNTQVEKLFQDFNLAEVKNLRKEQKVIEDKIFEILKENSPPHINKILPTNPGEMEVGYDHNNNEFYFVMFDPDAETENELIAIIINEKKEVKREDNFQYGDD
jgi:hypothetical protein